MKPRAHQTSELRVRAAGALDVVAALAAILGAGHAQTVALTTMVLFNMFHVGNCRSERLSVFLKSPFSNMFLRFRQARPHRTLSRDLAPPRPHEQAHGAA